MSAFVSVSGFIVIVTGIASILGGPILWGLVALIAGIGILHRKFEILNAPVEMFKNTLESIKDTIQTISQTDFIRSILRAKDIIEDLTIKNLITNIIAEKETAKASSLNGEIRLSASHGTKIEQAELFTDQPGNLGFNMGASH
jgi:hypothetical protein